MSPKARRSKLRPRPYRPRELRDAGVRPAKALGQHFLTDYAYVDRIVRAVELSSDDTVVEVGSGLGVLTERLAAVAGRVIAVEVDAKLAARLRHGSAANVTVVQADVLGLEPEELLQSTGLQTSNPYVLVGNLPYNVGTAIVRHFLEADSKPEKIIVMLQKEVADEIAAPQGELGLLSVSAQVYARARKLFNVPPRAFYPPPRVTSAVIRLEPYAEPVVPVRERDAFFKVVRAGFSAPRKQLRNTLSQGLALPPDEVSATLAAAGVDAQQRPQRLSIQDWVTLSRAFGGVE